MTLARLSSVADWKLEVLGEERDPEISPRTDLRRYGAIVLAFLLGWLAAIVLPQRFPLP